MRLVRHKYVCFNILVLGRSGSGSSFTVQNRKYQSSDAKQVSNRWSGLNSVTGSQLPQRQQSWKNAQNGNGSGNTTGSFDRPGFREKTGSSHQFEKQDNIGNKKNHQESLGNQQTENVKSSNESALFNEQSNNFDIRYPQLNYLTEEKSVENFKHLSVTPTKISSQGHFDDAIANDLPRNSEINVSVIPKSNTSESTGVAMQSIHQPDKWNYLDPNGVRNFRVFLDLKKIMRFFSVMASNVYKLSASCHVYFLI